MTTLPQSEFQPPKTLSTERYNMPSLVTVYYDGKCGLCRKEISHYKKIATEGQFIWSDIAHDAAPLSELGVSQMDALRRLHATDRNGKLHIGVDAFILIWGQLPTWRPLAILVGLPVVRYIAEMLYNRFVDYRFARLEHCQISEIQGK
jgi:predicted DCC family thiol-disulfide oxidoreductase YuxK